MMVIELGHIVAGPTAGLLFSDLNFDVIKIEKPLTGDISRSLINQSSGIFPFLNRNKKSLTLDLKSPEGREIFMKLAKKADIIIDNFSRGTMENLDLSYKKLMEINHNLIYLSLKGYSNEIYKNRKSLDFPIEVHTGIAYMNGINGKPLRLGGSIVDITSALFGVIAVLNALIEREKTHSGKYIDIGLFESAAFLMGQHIATYQLINRPLRPINDEGFAWGIYDFFRTKDNRDIFIAIISDNEWVGFCKYMKINIDYNKYLTNNERLKNRKYLIPLIAEIIGNMDSSSLKKIMDKLNISYSFYNKPWDLLYDNNLEKNFINEKYLNKIIRIPVNPVKTINKFNPPELGNCTNKILKSLGYTDEYILYLKKHGII